MDAMDMLAVHGLTPRKSVTAVVYLHGGNDLSLYSGSSVRSGTREKRHWASCFNRRHVLRGWIFDTAPGSSPSPASGPVHVLLPSNLFHHPRNLTGVGISAAKLLYAVKDALAPDPTRLLRR